MSRISSAILETFESLLAEAKAAGEPEAIAMNLATCDENNRVTSRMVLLKAADARGFVFYTNIDSRKGKQLTRQPQAAVCFHWKHLRNGVQVRAEGVTELVSDAEADAYFASRPRGSQIGAWASEQSAPMASRELFETRIGEIEHRFHDQDVPRPPNWSGYRLVPDRIEFWYGAEFRLHERQVFIWQAGLWQNQMLFP